MRAHLIDPDNPEHAARFYEIQAILAGLLVDAREGASSDEEAAIIADIESASARLFEVEEALIEDPELTNIVPLYRGTYTELQAEFDAAIEELFLLDQGLEQQAEADLTSEINQSITIGLALLVILLTLSVAIVFLLTRSILTPLGALNAASNEIAGGNINTPMPPRSPDEIGDLRDSFATMVDAIRRTLESLQARTRDLQTVADVNDQISTVLDLGRLLQDVADLTKERFGLYHAHIYAYDAEEQLLRLTAGAGHVGRQMVAEERIIDIANPDSIVAEAARSRGVVAIGDVKSSPTFLPHRLLPNTASESAFALVARGQLLGVLDVQSDKVNYFGEDVLDVLGLMAGQISSAISNARLYTAADRASRFEQAIGRLDRQLQAAVDIDEILQTTVRELGKALRVTSTAVELSLDDWAVHQTLAKPTNGSRHTTRILEAGTGD